MFSQRNRKFQPFDAKKIGQNRQIGKTIAKMPSNQNTYQTYLSAFFTRAFDRFSFTVATFVARFFHRSTFGFQLGFFLLFHFAISFVNWTK